MERVADRTVDRQRFVNPDGSVTDQISLQPRFFRQGNDLVPIDTTLAVDGSRAAKTLGAGARGVAASNNWFATRLGNLAQGVTFAVGVDSVTMTPQGAAALPDPLTLGNVAVYRDVWPGVDVRYRVTPTGLKEELVLKAPTAASSYSFGLSGASTSGPVAPGKGDIAEEFSGSIGFAGPLGKSAMFAPPVVTGDGDGRVFPEAVPTLSSDGVSVTVGVDAGWLRSLPVEAFPVVVDPTITNRAGTGWVSYNNAGGSLVESYVGNSCTNPPGCSLYDWRSIAKFNHGELYSQFVSSAVLTVPAAAVGNPGDLLLTVGPAAAPSYAGAGAPLSGGLAESGFVPGGGGGATLSMDVTDMMQAYADTDPANLGYLGFSGFQVGGYYSLHRVGFSTINVTYESVGQVKDLSPGSGFRSHSRRPVLTATVGNPNGSTIINVGFEVNCPGQAPVTSGWIAWYSGSPYSWTVPADLPWNAECWWRATGRNSSYWTESVWYSIMAVSQPPPTPLLDRVLDGTVVTGPSVAVSAPSFTDPDGDPVFVEYSIGTGSDGVSGRVVRSASLTPGAAFVASTSALPDGVYYATVRGVDSTGAASVWAKPVVFRVAQRLGVQDKLAYDSAGPFTVNVGSGNLVVKAGGPLFSTLGGEAGVSFTYNSQAVVPRGLTAAFYDDKNADGLLQSTGPVPDVKKVERIDPVASFDWNNTAGPVPGAVNPESFVGVWSGVYKNTSGVDRTVQFQVAPIDATAAGNKVKVTVNGSSVSAWSTATAGVSVGAGATVAVSVEYGKVASVSSSGFRVMFSEGSGWADVPADRWLQFQPVLPGGWSSTGPSLGTVGYTRLSAGENQVSLYDDSGAAHVWASTGDGFVPPPGEDGTLRRLPVGFTYVDGSGPVVSSGFELAAEDGYVYLFNGDGLLVSVVAPSDAVNPGALRYTYTQMSASGPVRLTTVTDPLGGR